MQTKLISKMKAMTPRIFKNILLIFLAVIALTGCTKNDDIRPEEGTEEAVVEEFLNTTVRISEPTTWKADKIYVFKSSIVEIESELIIEPGTVMKFDNSSSMIVRQGEHGRITANGTAGKRIVFTSYTDNTHGGKTQTGGAAPEPKRGDWGGITIDGGNNHSFTYADFLYAGGKAGYGTHSAVWFDNNAGGTFTFDHCVFAHTLGDDKKYLNPDSPGLNGAFEAIFVLELPNPETIRFTNNLFYDNDVPMVVNSYFPVDASNKFHNPDNPAEKNDRNMIHLFGWSHQEANVTWGHTEAPYAYTGSNEHTAKSLHTITIGPDVIVKFPGVGAGINGWNNVRNIKLAPTATLTSYHDDANGGDSNGNGAATSPNKGDWNGFVIRSSSGRKYDVWPDEDNILYASRP